MNFLPNNRLAHPPSVRFWCCHPPVSEILDPRPVSFVYLIHDCKCVVCSVCLQLVITTSPNFSTSPPCLWPSNDREQLCRVHKFRFHKNTLTFKMAARIFSQIRFHYSGVQGIIVVRFCTQFGVKWYIRGIHPNFETRVRNNLKSIQWYPKMTNGLVSFFINSFNI